MIKRKGAIAFLMAVLLASTGCQRWMAPVSPNQGQPGTRSPQISAAKTRADYYDGVVTDKVSAQTGMDGNTPINYTLQNGQSVKIIGKYDGYYVAVLPNKQIGLVPQGTTKPATQANTPANQPAPVPSLPQGTGTGNRTTTGNRTASPPTTPSATPQGDITKTASSADASTMINLVNQARSQAGLKPLSSNGPVANLAGMKAADIAKNNYFSHNSPTYGSPFDMMKKYGVSYLYAGENLAINQNVQSAEQALMNSPEHKANILNPNFTDIGIGIAQKSDGSKVYVQMFIGK